MLVIIIIMISKIHHVLKLVCGLEHFLFFNILGISSSQLTNSIIFQRGRSTTNQKTGVFLRVCYVSRQEQQRDDQDARLPCADAG